MLRLFLAVILLSFMAPYGYSQVLLTPSAQTSGKGTLRAGVGVEYYSKHTSPGPDLPVTETRLFTAAAHMGVADNVNFDLDWRGLLLATTSSGELQSDWGDLTVSTRIRFVSEDENVPAIGVRSSVKLPNTSFVPYPLGSNETDYGISLLLTKAFGSLEARMNLGFSILGDPVHKGTQNDVYSLGILMLLPGNEAFQPFVECFGFSGYMKDDDKLVVRGGATVPLSNVLVNIYASVRALGSNKDFGTAFELSENWSVVIMLLKDFHLPI